jgi:phage repressor protein C with HTH and peptisase S24 domain
MEPNATPTIQGGAQTQPQPVAQTQPQPIAQTQSQGQSLDPGVLALTKSIGMAESGGDYNAGDSTGDNANSTGAFQMTPAFLEEYAPKAGVQYTPGQQLTPQQQNEIAYSIINEWGTTGDPAYPELGKLTPAQIASAWNAGNPDAYIDPTYGANNTYGSTQNYVNEVEKYFNQATGINTADAASSAPSSSSSGSSLNPAEEVAGLGLAGLGSLWSLISPYVSKPLTDAAVDAGIGAVGGEAVDPLGGGVVGAVGGAVTGVAQGVVQDIAGGGNSTPPPTDTSSTSAPADQPAPINDQNQAEPAKAQVNAGEPAQPAQTTQPDAESLAALAASATLKNGVSQIMQGNQPASNYANTPAGKDSVNTASQFGLIEDDGNGRASFNEEKRQQVEGAVEEGKDNLIDAQENSSVPVSTLGDSNRAGSFIEGDRINTKDDRNKAADIVQRELKADSGGRGKMTDKERRAAQKTHHLASKASYSNPKPNAEMLAHKALAHAYGESIRGRIKEEDKPLYDKLTKMSRDLTNAKNLKKYVQGKKLPKNKGMWESFLRQGARAAEIYIGDKLGGPVGAIIGGMVGEKLNDKITNHFGNNIFETKGMKTALNTLRDTKPKAYNDLMAALKKRGVNVPKDEAKKPTTKEGLVKIVKKDMRDITPPKKTTKPQKGLVDIKQPSGKKGLVSLRSNTAKL